MVDFGSDISTFPDLDPTFAPISGNRSVAECVARRFMTPNGGGLFYDVAFGYDLRSLLNKSFTPAELSAVGRALEQEALKDERVLDSSVSVSLVNNKMTVTASLTTSTGPFTLVMSIDAVSVQLLKP